MPELSVVVPAFRERDNIPALLDALEQALAGLDWETIIVVDDAFDGTEGLVRERAQRDPRVRCIHCIGRRGLASACIEGMLASSAPYVAVIDADLQHDETLVPQLLEAAKRDRSEEHTSELQSRLHLVCRLLLEKKKKKKKKKKQYKRKLTHV